MRSHHGQHTQHSKHAGIGTFRSEAIRFEAVPNARRFVLAAGIALILIVASVGYPLLHNQMKQESRAEGTAPAPIVEEVDVASYSPDVASLSRIPASVEGVHIFSLKPDEPESSLRLSQPEQLIMTAALAPYISTDESIGFALVDLDTGHGIAYNVDEYIFGASSFKGPYATYICEQLLDGGIIERDSPCANVGSIDPLGTPRTSSFYSVDSLMEDMVISSDNNAFRFLRSAYDGEGFTDWLTSLGVDATIADDTTFPRYCVRDSLRLWMETYRYLETGSENAEWLKGLFSSTELSFIRNALDEQTGIVTIYDKGGWNADSSSSGRFDSVSDAGIIEDDDRHYLLCALSSTPDSPQHEQQLQNLIATLYSLRGSLAETS